MTTDPSAGVPNGAVAGVSLVGVSIVCDDLERAAHVYSAVTGILPTVASSSVTFTLSDARIILRARTNPDQPSGIASIIYECDLYPTRKRLVGEDIPFTDDGLCLKTQRSFAGAAIELVHRCSGSADIAADQANRPETELPARLDHVAILVADIATMSRRWSAILGQHVEPAVHPLGTAVAARFILGPRMTELLAPLPGSQSGLAARLEKAGEGPFALAIIATNITERVEAVRSAGARVSEQPPHLVVHPADAAGVPIQLTPRVSH